MHDDLQVFRLFELDKCFRDGQFPCRWVPDAGFGYGYPLMQFYPPMPYYPMEILKLLGLGFFWPIKIMFALSFILSGVGMFLLAKEFFGKWGGLLSALFYVYAPYHSVDVYVRGAQNEAWGMVWFPFVLLYIYRLLTQKFSRKNFVLFSLFLAFQLTSHNVMTLIFAPTAILWGAFWLLKTKNYSAIKNLLLSGVLGVGLAAFFFIPVVLEQKYVHVESMTYGYFNYMAHFADLSQMFTSRFWGYGGSTWGPDDGMSFSIGQLQWLVALVALVIAVFRFKKDTFLSLMIFMSVSFALFYAFLAHGRSLPLWERLPMLQYAQFPWRLIALVVFYFSFVTGYLAKIKLPKIFRASLVVLLSLGVILWNLPFFRVERHTRITIEEKTAGRQWLLQVTGGIFDYLPRSAKFPPGEPAFTTPVFVEGYGGVLNYQAGTNWLTFEANVSSPSAVITLPLFTYPGLVVKVDGQKVTSSPYGDLGLVSVALSQGKHTVWAKITNTPVRLISDLITLVSLVIIILLVCHAKHRPRQ